MGTLGCLFAGPIGLLCGFGVDEMQRSTTKTFVCRWCGYKSEVQKPPLIPITPATEDAFNCVLLSSIVWLVIGGILVPLTDRNDWWGWYLAVSLAMAASLFLLCIICAIIFGVRPRVPSADSPTNAQVVPKPPVITVSATVLRRLNVVGSISGVWFILGVIFAFLMDKDNWLRPILIQSIAISTVSFYSFFLYKLFSSPRGPAVYFLPDEVYLGDFNLNPTVETTQNEEITKENDQSSHSQESLLPSQSASTEESGFDPDANREDGVLDRFKIWFFGKEYHPLVDGPLVGWVYGSDGIFYGKTRQEALWNNRQLLARYFNNLPADSTLLNESLTDALLARQGFCRFYRDAQGQFFLLKGYPAAAKSLVKGLGPLPSCLPPTGA